MYIDLETVLQVLNILLKSQRQPADKVSFLKRTADFS